MLELYEQLVEHTLIEPTFVRDYPADGPPLARPHRDDPRLAEAWDLVINGVELAPAYSELVDPVEQRRRLTEQSLQAAGGDPEAMQLDEDFLRALEHGVPPTGGMGMGVDRLVMLLTGANIRETITVPAGAAENSLTSLSRRLTRVAIARSATDVGNPAHCDCASVSNSRYLSRRGISSMAQRLQGPAWSANRSLE